MSAVFNTSPSDVSRKKKVISIDLDNTLWDFTHYYTRAMRAAIQKIGELTGADHTLIRDQIRAITTKYHDLEYPFIFQELPLLQAPLLAQEKNPNVDAVRQVCETFEKEKKRSLHLYPRVTEVLDVLNHWRHSQRAMGQPCEIIAVTDSQLLPAIEKLYYFNLSAYFDCVYCRSPAPLAPKDYMKTTREALLETQLKIRVRAHELKKPDSAILREIVGEKNPNKIEVTHIGDSMSHDVKMATTFGCASVLATYGHPSKEEALFLAQIAEPYNTNASGDSDPATHVVSTISELLRYIVPEYEQTFYRNSLFYSATFLSGKSSRYNDDDETDTKPTLERKTRKSVLSCSQGG